MTAQTADTQTAAVVTAELHLTTDRETLLSALTFVAGAAAKRAQLPILSCVALESGRAYAFDFETGASQDLPIHGFGRVAVNADTFAKMVKSLDKRAAVTVTARAETVTGERSVKRWENGANVDKLESFTEHTVTATLTAGKVTFDLPTHADAEEMPALPDVTAGSLAFVADASVLRDAFARVAISAGKDDTLPVLTGACITVDASGVEIATTDRYRLGVQNLAPIVRGDDDAKILLPIRAAVWSVKNLEGAVSVRVHGDHVEISAAERTVHVRTLDGEFPRYRSLIPDTFNATASFSVKAMTAAVKRMSLALESRTAPVVLEIADGAIAVCAGKSRETVSATLAGFDELGMRVGYNVVYLLDAIGAESADETTMHLVTATKPAVIRSAAACESTYQHLLMPVRLSD